MKKSCEDCWPPLPGSWEELVDSYDTQCAKFSLAIPNEEQQQLPLEVIPDPQAVPAYPIPVAA